MIKNTSSKGFFVAWVLLVGIWASIISAVIGTICCLSIIGIPFGIKHFKFIPIIFMSSGKTVVYRPTPKRRVLNVIWCLFGGYGARFCYSLLAFVLRITVIGVPLALQIDRIYAYLKGPYGAEIVEYGKYTPQRNTMYDYTLLQRKICKNPDLTIFDDTKGRVVTVKKFISRFEEEIFTIKRNSQIVMFLFASLALFGIAGIAINPFLGISLIAFGVVVCIIMAEYRSWQYLRFYDKHMRRLFKLYPEEAEYDPLPAGIKPYYAFEYLSKVREQRRRRSISDAAARANKKRELEEAKKKEEEKVNQNTNQ